MAVPASSAAEEHMNIRTDSAQALSATLANYTLPTQRLRRRLHDSKRRPLVLVSCGSFSPITYLHLRMFELAKDWVKRNTDWEVVGGYFSPVSDAYKKAGLAEAHHRINMCQLAVDSGSDWIMVDAWEPLQKEYVPTAKVLDHFEQEISQKFGKVESLAGESKSVHVALLAGADLIQTMSQPGVWSHNDLDHILGHYGALIIERAGTDINEALASLQKYSRNLHVINALIQNDVSSTKVRSFLKKDMSVRYLIPEPVVKYVQEHGLYQENGEDIPDQKPSAQPLSDGAKEMPNGAAL